MMFVDRDRVYDDEYSDTAWWQTDYFENVDLNGDVSVHSIRSVRSVRALNRSGHSKVGISKVIGDGDDNMSSAKKVGDMEMPVDVSLHSTRSVGSVRSLNQSVHSNGDNTKAIVDGEDNMSSTVVATMGEEEPAAV